MLQVLGAQLVETATRHGLSDNCDCHALRSQGRLAFRLRDQGAWTKVSKRGWADAVKLRKHFIVLWMKLAVFLEGEDSTTQCTGAAPGGTFAARMVSAGRIPRRGSTLCTAAREEPDRACKVVEHQSTLGGLERYHIPFTALRC